MAIIDKKLMMIDSASYAAVTTSGVQLGTALDLGAAGKDGWGVTLTESPGEGNPKYFHVNQAALGSAHAVTFGLYAGSVLGSSSAVSSGAIVCNVVMPATAAVGERRSAIIPAGGLARYVRVIGNGHASATGSIDAWISDKPFDSEMVTAKLK